LVKEATSYKIITDSMSNHMTMATLIAADLTKTPVTVQVSQDKNDHGYPQLVLGNGTKLHYAYAIGSFLASESSSTHNLLGKTPFERLQVDQYAAIASTLQAVSYIEDRAFGVKKNDNPQDLKNARTKIEEIVRNLDNHLKGNKKFLVGESITLADILMFCTLMTSY